jgi:protein SCO1/2
MKRVPGAGLRIVAVLVIAFTSLTISQASASAALPDWITFWEDDEYEFNGGFFDPPKEAQPLQNAVDQNGEPFSLEENRGKVVFLYFGYTHCPDACPATLAEWMEMKEILGDEADNVVFAMVTVDPARDTPERLGEYLEFFDPEFYGVSMSEEDTEAVAKDWNILYTFEEPDQTGGYLVNHEVSSFVVDPDGNLRLTYPLGFDPELMAEDVKHLLDED